MEKFTCNVESESYEIIQHSVDPMTFRVLHRSGMHQIGRKEDGEYVSLLHEPFAEPIPLSIIGKEVEKHL